MNRITSAFLNTLSLSAPQELRGEERPEAALAKQRELATVAHADGHRPAIKRAAAAQAPDVLRFIRRGAAALRLPKRLA